MLIAKCYFTEWLWFGILGFDLISGDRNERY